METSARERFYFLKLLGFRVRARVRVRVRAKLNRANPSKFDRDFDSKIYVHRGVKGFRD